MTDVKKPDLSKLSPLCDPGFRLDTRPVQGPRLADVTGVDLDVVRFLAPHVLKEDS